MATRAGRARTISTTSAALLAAALTAHLGDVRRARGDEVAVDARIDALALQLSAPEAAVRKKALDALRALGDPAIEPLLRKAGDDPGAPASEAALVALASLDPDEALARVETSRSRWESYGWMREMPERKGRRVVDLLVERLIAARKTSWTKPVPLEAGLLSDAFRVPPWAERRIEKDLPSDLVWAEVPVRAKGTALEVDAALDGRFSTKVDDAKGQVVAVGPAERARKVLVQKRLDAWYASSPHVARATVDGTAVELLDAEADGAFDGRADLVRFGDGAFRPLADGPFAWTAKGLVRFRLRREGGALTIATIPEPAPRWMDAGAAAGMDAVNRWRNAAGLAPHRIDETRWRACGLHHDYWKRNGFSAHDEDAEKPGWTSDGATAGRSSSVWASPDAVEFVARIGGSVLHRASLVGRPGEGVAFYAGPAGSLLWGAEIEGASRGFPVAIPGPGQTDVPLNCEEEMPKPARDAAFYSKARGYPVSVTWSGLAAGPVAKRRIDLVPEGSAKPLPGTLFSAESPYHPDYRNGFPDDSAIFVPDSPLAGGTTYVAQFRADGAAGPIDVSWRFRTK